MSTKAEVRQRVGENLGLVPIGQALENQDKVRIDATYDEAYQILKEKGIVSWALTGDVPDKLVPSFALYITFMLLTSYSVPESRYIRIMNEAGEDGKKAVSMLSALTVQEYTSNDDYTDY